MAHGMARKPASQPLNSLAEEMGSRDQERDCQNDF